MILKNNKYEMGYLLDNLNAAQNVYYMFDRCSVGPMRPLSTYFSLILPLLAFIFSSVTSAAHHFFGKRTEYYDLESNGLGSDSY